MYSVLRGTSMPWTCPWAWTLITSSRRLYRCLESRKWFLKVCCYANGTSSSNPPPLQSPGRRENWQRSRKSKKKKAAKAREGRGPVCVMHQRSASLPFQLQSLGGAANPRPFVGFCRLVPGMLSTIFPLLVISERESLVSMFYGASSPGFSPDTIVPSDSRLVPITQKGLLGQPSARLNKS
ncbi:hypothetical protein BO78DRAFT_42312 [Aspergillus sclerotiicarbonarius CBS 121057]|uniref:Uncharacterized protein n=1 Tax=Aspergillus sclerotiicarbonarius (strain CBS 121057 / IBT 28362) TaxID=1448318 RepID=A0A319E1T6_ASPSB|nr:hypothetical protein BO78DRAFT_42312 [Aspergillus sclerotiicarbonarius CBS 121057]